MLLLPAQAGVTRPETYSKTQSIFLEIGKFLQIEDDFLGCFGDPKVTGKKGNDIVQGRISWLIVMAMQRANKEQKQILMVRTHRDRQHQKVFIGIDRVFVLIFLILIL